MTLAKLWQDKAHETQRARMEKLNREIKKLAENQILILQQSNATGFADYALSRQLRVESLETTIAVRVFFTNLLGVKSDT